MTADTDVLKAAVGAVEDPELARGIGELGMVRSIEAQRRRVTIELAAPVRGWPGVEALEAAVRSAASDADPSCRVDVEWHVMDETERASIIEVLSRPSGGEPMPFQGRSAGGHGHGGAPKPLGHEQGRPNRFMMAGSKTRVIGISSGKGGVGKSSVAVNLAIALGARGYEVGLLDADVYGFSVPKMLGIERKPVHIDNLLIPPVVAGVRCLSMGYFVADDQPVVWRGPMLHKALEQFLVDAYWGEPDFLLVDMPPGTGDVTLSLGQYLPRTEVVVVTTPQAASQRVAQRSAIAARALKLPVRGVIENMAWFTGDDGRRYEIFGSGGGASLAESLSVPLLGQIPLLRAVREGGDIGLPITVSDPTGEAALAFGALSDRLVEMGPARIYRSELSVS